MISCLSVGLGGGVGTVHELESQKLWSFSGMVETVILGIM